MTISSPGKRRTVACYIFAMNARRFEEAQSSISIYSFCFGFTCTLIRRWYHVFLFVLDRLPAGSNCSSNILDPSQTLPRYVVDSFDKSKARFCGSLLPLRILIGLAIKRKVAKKQKNRSPQIVEKNAMGPIWDAFYVAKCLRILATRL